MIEYALTNAMASAQEFMNRLPGYIRDLDPKVVLALAGVVVFLAFTLRSGTRH